MDNLTLKVPTEWMGLLHLEHEVKDLINTYDNAKVYKDILHVIKKRKMELHPVIVSANSSELVRITIKENEERRARDTY